MSTLNHQITVAEEAIMNKIYVVRGQKVMIDRDLAVLYGVETKRLKEAVRRNIARFPEDFMFEMSKEELESWRTQNATSKEDKQGLRYAPFCFSEQGVTMLSCILNSERAIAVNIQVIRVFSKMREMLLAHKDILLKLEQLEQKTTAHDKDLQIIFTALKKLLNPPNPPRERIGFKRSGEE
ncbi:MAG: ORF6N domain-containing protein [Chitinophagaceae bacterium]|nr:ORF6N domain-containing protein [Chitinophagaceae bacterium]